MRRLFAGLLLVAAACGTIGSPLITSTDVYEFRDIEAGTTVIFHWTQADLPVRVWVASDSPIRQNVETAIARWEGAFLYGEFQATLVADSTTADVIVRNEPSDIGSGLARRARECAGETDPNIDLSTNTAQLPMHVFVYPAASDVDPVALATCYSITVTHEFGHVLGIINAEHAGTNSGDVMFPNPTFDGISERDRATINTLYDLFAPTITITGRR
jgi:predicted Zn-dependent protease